MNNNKNLQIAVIGPAGEEEYPNGGGASKAVCRAAESIGFLLAKAGAKIVTGGKSGIMESASKGAEQAGGISIGIVSGRERFVANRYTDVEIPTGTAAPGFDEFFIVLTADALIAIGGGAGTLQEITLAYRMKKPVILLQGFGGWTDQLENTFLDERKSVPLQKAKTPEEAVRLALHHAPSL